METATYNDNEFNVILSWLDGWIGWRYHKYTFIEFHTLVGKQHSSFLVSIDNLEKILEEVKKNEEPLPF
jgi:hypothetical protein